ncbi:hypothetical protein [uncultured Clostridium sp.]|uniref:hypothetical protein n=1 Tax=uncultured Clostridium sp. TaxID=59620 RepID=UPI0025E4E98B|nr:hypothetical protein [uncultured Clostridium sp.]
MNKIKLIKPKFIDELEDIEDFYEEVVISDRIRNKTISSELIENIDLTTCEISGISLDINDVRGVIVTQLQAVDLTRLMDIIIS